MVRTYLAIALTVGMTAVAFGADLSKELKEERESILAKLEKLQSQMTDMDPRNLELSLEEMDVWVDEFLDQASLPDDDPIATELKERLADVHKGAKDSAQDRMAKKEMAAKAAMNPEKSDRQKLDELLKIEVDLKNISFKRDVAPIIADSCLGCHNGRRAAGDFDASTFANFVAQVDPGSPEDSHILNLVTGKEMPVMPRGNRGFPAEWVDIWTAWIKQGAKFDGTKPTAPITDYLVDADAKRRERIAKLSPDELAGLHRLAASRQISVVNPRQTVFEYESPNFLVRTTLDERDAEYIAVLAEAILEEVGPKFKLKPGAPAFAGRMGLMVFRDRYDYIAFARQIDNYSPEEFEFGHARNRPEFEYVAMTTEGDGRSLDLAVAEQVLAAFYQSLGKGKMPDWAIYGSSRSAAAEWDPSGAPSIRSELHVATEPMTREGWSASLLEGKLPWVEAGPLSVSLFTFLQAEQGRKLPMLQMALADGKEPKEAFKQILGVDEEHLRAVWYPWALRKYGKGR